METVGPDSMKQTIQYMMVPKDYPDSHGGLVSKEVKTKDKFYKEVEVFINEQ
jgi:hypothetical protein